ncbi:MAG: MotA/TolQ/ExbB proton channel family protein [Spirochaetales bacterium]|nr:MotA/TolQ/ExbB proton channel family protein [Spirochaetales bacterium]
MDLLQKGGPILWIIIGLSFLALVIIIERLLYLKKIKVDEEKLFLRVKAALEKGHFDEALFMCESNLSPITGIMKAAIEHRSEEPYVLKETLKDAASQQAPLLEKNLSNLGTIAHISPLLGLLGTVTGNINAFGVLGSFGSVSDPSVLARGISEALITTAAGLIVSIPAVIFYNFFVTRINNILVKMENQVNDMILLMKNAGSAEARRTAPRPAEPRPATRTEARTDARRPGANRPGGAEQ